MANTQATFDGLRKGIAITPSSLRVNPMSTVEEEGMSLCNCHFQRVLASGRTADGRRTDELRDIF